MTSRFARLCSAAALWTFVSLARAQAPGPLPQNPPPPTLPGSMAPARPAANPPTAAARPTPSDDELVSLKLPDADIDTVLSALETFTGKIILRPSSLPTAQGGYNLKINKPIPKSEAVLYIETILAMNNIAVIPMGNDALKVVQLPSARVEAPELIEGSTLQMPASSKVASKLFQLDFLRVQEFQQMLATIANPNFGATTALPNANAILVTDTVSNLQRIETILQAVDKPSMAGMVPKFYQLRSGAKASDVVGKLHNILTGTLQAQLGMATTYSADDRTNQIILITDPRQFPFFDDLIAKLDIISEPNTRNEVIFLKHAKAADVVQVLVHLIQNQNQITQRAGTNRPNQPTSTPAMPTPNQPPGAPPGPTVFSGTSAGNPAFDQGNTNEFSSMVTVVNDDRSNSIVVSGTLDDIRLMKDLINSLDNVLPQVRIEVVIAEVTLDDNHQSGISQLGLQVSGDKLIGFTGGMPGLSIGGDGNSTFASITRPGGTVPVSGPWDLAGIISLGITPRKNNTTVLSVPSVTTSHAKQATFISSEKRPIVTGTTQVPVGATTASSGFSTSQQVAQQDIGITLTVTPLIGSDQSVQMDIDADVEDVIGTVPINGVDQPIISHRETKSTITSQSGEIIVIGGMQRHKDSRQTNRLGPIPILGDLLGSRTKTTERTELIFFLRAHVLSSSEVDNAPDIKRMRDLPAKDVPQKEEMMKLLDPNYVPPKKSVLDKILPH